MIEYRSLVSISWVKSANRNEAGFSKILESAYGRKIGLSRPP
jgi:hypothetical protein